MALSYEPKTPLGRFVNELEETVIASLLGIMTLITFTNVVLRYGFNTGLIWGLEMVTFLFAWLVLFGASYAVKVTAHLGVDVVVTCLDRAAARLLHFWAHRSVLVMRFLFSKDHGTIGQILPTCPKPLGVGFQRVLRRCAGPLIVVGMR